MKAHQLLSLIAVILLPALVQAKEGFAQFKVKQGQDTNKIVTIVYPTITKREGQGLNIPKPPKEHPRLFFRAKDIPALKTKVHDPLMKECWDRIVKSAALKTDGRLKQDGGKENLDNAIREAIEAKALLYAFSGQRELGRDAVDALLNYYATVKIDLAKDPYYASIDLGRTILLASMVYDWCYNLLTPEEKKLLVGRMETMATQLEIKWPYLIEGSIVGHGNEAQFSRDMLACGIATYDEKPQIYNLVAGRILAEFVPVRKFFYPASYHHQGTSYGPSRFHWEIWSTFLFDRMGHPNVYGTDQGKVPYRWIYLRRPDGQLFRDGDGYKENIEFGKYWNNPGDALTGFYFNDPIIIGEAIKQGFVGKTSDYLFDYLFFNTTVEPHMDKEGLPLTKYFKEPLGAMVARTGWEEGIESRAVVAEMKIGMYYFLNHQHLDAGSFQLYYKGPLAIESGIYEGTHGYYGSDHFKHYYQRTIAHNSMLVYDPAEKFFWENDEGKMELRNDGGQQYPENKKTPDNLEEFLKKDFKTGEVLAHGFGPDTMKPEFSYLKGELAEAYSDKIKSFRRSFVFLNMNDPRVPAALVVFDKVVASNKDFKKYWLLHCIEEPVVSGNIAVIKRSEKGYDGKMINTTLLPSADNLTVNKIGGPGKEFDVFGVNYTQASHRPETNSVEGGAWRIEVFPRNAALIDNFLNVMQVMDNDENASPLSVEKMEAGKMVGTKIGNRIVLFSTDGEVIAEKVKIKITGEGNFKVLLTDMEEGEWKIECLTNTKNSIPVIKNDKQLLYFDAKSGDYIISKK
ncbi:MAG: heparin/heparin-sulfate lyase HepB [Cyclobacteriaceae bacterium]